MPFTVKHFEQIKTQTRTENKKRQRVSETAIKKNFCEMFMVLFDFPQNTHNLDGMRTNRKKNKTKQNKKRKRDRVSESFDQKINVSCFDVMLWFLSGHEYATQRIYINM